MKLRWKRVMGIMTSCRLRGGVVVERLGVLVGSARGSGGVVKEWMWWRRVEADSSSWANSTLTRSRRNSAGLM